MYICYLDESGTPEPGASTDHFVLLGLAVPAHSAPDWHRAPIPPGAILTPRCRGARAVASSNAAERHGARNQIQRIAGRTANPVGQLSGGEQALTAVALIFGLFLTNPAPICVLDEVDAPLDDANIERFCGLLDVMSRDTDTRYLIVTHNAVTMSRMHRLFGVTMIERGVSKLVSVDLGGAEELLAAE